MENKASDLHIVMFPWLAFGHLIPFYQLSLALAKQAIRISYVSTPKNIERLPKIPPPLAHLVQYISLAFPVLPGNSLAQGAEATVDLESEQIPYLKVAYDLLHEPFKQFVLSNSLDWIICDFAAHWMPQIAQECKCELMYFSVFTTSTLLFLGPPEYLTGEGQKQVRGKPETVTTQPPWGKILPPSVVFQGYEAEALHSGLYTKNISGVTNLERLASMIKGCKAVAIRTCREFEGEYIDVYQTLIHKPVVPIGLLPPVELEEKGDTSEIWEEVFKWLDQQSPRSVIYVGFGSEYKLTRNEVYEIAYGLELAQLPFIWALRRPNWAQDDSEALPPGFVSRTSGKGIVCFGWAPQLKILAHPSVGGCLFHSGWGSVIEALQHGHSLVLLPFVLDQGLNARMIVEKGLGIEVDRREDGSYTRDDIANALKQALLGNEAQNIRTRVRQVATIFSDQKLHGEHYIGNLTEYLRRKS